MKPRYKERMLSDPSRRLRWAHRLEKGESYSIPEGR